MIKPTIGRVVWFWPDSAFTRCTQPQAALIAWVHSDSVVNLAIFDANGKSSNRTGVPLFQGEGNRPESHYCEWMPYQIGQAAKEPNPDNLRTVSAVEEERRQQPAKA